MAINRMNHVFNMVKATGDDAPSIEVLVDMLQDFRTGSKKFSREIDDRLIRDIRHLFEGINKAREEQAKLREINEKLTEPPWHLGMFERSAETAVGRAIVNYHGARRVVNLAQGVDLCESSPVKKSTWVQSSTCFLEKPPMAFPNLGISETSRGIWTMEESSSMLGTRNLS